MLVALELVELAEALALLLLGLFGILLAVGFCALGFVVALVRALRGCLAGGLQRAREVLFAALFS